jgi:hypothetical protein
MTVRLWTPGGASGTWPAPADPPTLYPGHALVRVTGGDVVSFWYQSWWSTSGYQRVRDGEGLIRGASRRIAPRRRDDRLLRRMA